MMREARYMASTAVVVIIIVETLGEVRVICMICRYNIILN